MESVLSDISMGEFNYDDEDHLVSSKIVYKNKNLIVKLPFMKLVDIENGLSFLVENEYDKLLIKKMSEDVINRFGSFLSVRVDLTQCAFLIFDNNVLKIPMDKNECSQFKGLKNTSFSPKIHISRFELHKGYFKIKYSYLYAIK